MCPASLVACPSCVSVCTSAVDVAEFVVTVIASSGSKALDLTWQTHDGIRDISADVNDNPNFAEVVRDSREQLKTTSLYHIVLEVK